MQLKHKILSGPASNAQSVNHKDFKKKKADEDDGKNVNKADYYKFYLNNAQKAINLMIAQHKSQGNLMQPGSSSKDGVSRHHHFEMGSSAGDLSYEGEAAKKNLLANRKQNREINTSHP